MSFDRIAVRVYGQDEFELELPFRLEMAVAATPGNGTEPNGSDFTS